MITNADITIYNAYTSYPDRTDKYILTVIRGVNWQSSVNITQNDKAILTANLFKIRIPIDADFNGRQYKPSKEWLSLPESDKSNFWTIQNNDIIVRGITEIDIEHGSITKPSDLFNNFDEVAVVVSWSDNRRGSPVVHHWRIEGK